VPTRVLALFAKAPVAGQVKTRLAPQLRPDEAAALYEAMLLDILDQHALDTWRLALWFTPDTARDWFRAKAASVWALYAQSGPDLAARMRALFETHAAEGGDRIVLRGTDSPTLPADRVASAFEKLEANDLVLCPDRDGGYNLIGLRRPCPTLFELRLSTGSVLDETLAGADSAGLRVALLETHYDVDVPADLERLRADVTAARTPRTLRWLESHTSVSPGAW
jgi:rSAM/selenodomain-associated transferase 1